MKNTSIADDSSAYRGIGESADLITRKIVNAVTAVPLVDLAATAVLNVAGLIANAVDASISPLYKERHK